MPRTARRSPDNVVAMPTSEPTQINPRAESLEDAVARRAYELYRARGCEDGHDVEDWVAAEREIRAALSLTSVA